MNLRAPVELFWNSIGDPYTRIFRDDAKRPIEAMWQMITDLAADALDRVSEIRMLNAIFYAKPDVHWGRVPLDLEDDTVRVPLVVLAKRQDALGRWELVVLPPDGAVAPVAPGVIELSNGVVQPFFALSKLQGGFWVLLMTSEPELEVGSSAAFFAGAPSARFVRGGSYPFTTTANGLRFAPVAINWSILTDSSIQLPQDGELSWRADVSGWSRPTNPYAQKHLQAVVLGAQSLVWGIKQVGANLEVEAGTGYTSMTAMTVELGDLASLRTAIEATTNTVRLPVELSAVFDANAGTARLSVEAPGFRASVTLPWDLSAYYACINIFNGWGTLEGQVISLVTPSAAASVSAMTGTGPVWKVTPPIWSASRLTTFPWRLAIRGQMTQRSVAGNTFDVSTNGRAASPPAYGRVSSTSGSSWVKLLLWQDYTATYEVVQGDLPSWGIVEVEPWSLEMGEFAFDGPGRLRTALPPVPVRIWAIDARVPESQLFGRFGQVLGAPFQQDSQRYLNLLRGLYYGLHTSPAPRHTETAANWMLGLTASTKGGQITAIDTGYRWDGAPDRVIVTLDSGETMSVPWPLRHRVQPLGTTVAPWGTPVDGVRVWDFYSSPDIVKAKVANVFAHLSTFVVEIPADVGLSQDTFLVLRSMLMRSRDPHTLPQVEMSVTSPDESMQEALDGDRARGVTSAMGDFHLAHTREDVIFDDGQSVVGNDMLPNNEEQTPEALIMKGQQLTAEGLALSEGYTALLNPMFDEVGRILGEAYPRASLMAHRFFVAVGVSAKAPLAAWESTLGLTRTPLRTQGGWLGKPTAIARVLTQAGDAYTWHVPSWVTVPAMPSDDFYSVMFDSPMDVTVAGADGAMYRSTNYGATWSSAPSSLANDVVRMQGGWGWDATYAVVKRVAGTWGVVTPVGVDPGYWKAMAVDGDRLAFGGEDEAGLSYGYVVTSLDGGASWVQKLFSDTFSGDYVYGLGWDGATLLAATAGGLKTSTNGLTWAQTEADGIWGGLINGDRWVFLVGNVSGDLTVRRRLKGEVGAFEDVTTPGSGYTTVRGWSSGDDVVMLTSSGAVWHSRDAGVNWTLTLTSASIEDMAVARWGQRMVVGESVYARRWN